MNNTGWHEGERELQARVGVEEQLAELGPRLLRDSMPPQHREFFAQLPMLHAGTLDGEGQPWASLLAGQPGFAHSPTPRELRLDALPSPHDPAAAHFVAGAPVGLLGLQAHTRRRNRLNGWIAGRDARGFTVAVGQSFGNCPRYITPREVVAAPEEAPAQARVLTSVDEEALRLVRGADTFFIASAHPQAREDEDPSRGIDVSHRGGPAGFVQVDGDDTLVVADYAGNTFFNTLGNLQLEPRCGLLFVDYESGERLQLAARAELLWEGERRLRLHVQRGVHTRGGLPLRLRAAA